MPHVWSCFRRGTKPTTSLQPLVRSYRTVPPLPVPEGHRRSVLYCPCHEITPVCAFRSVVSCEAPTFLNRLVNPRRSQGDRGRPTYSSRQDRTTPIATGHDSPLTGGLRCGTAPKGTCAVAPGMVLVDGAGFEPAAFCASCRCSTRLSYPSLVEAAGFEPTSS